MSTKNYHFKKNNYTVVLFLVRYLSKIICQIQPISTNTSKVFSFKNKTDILLILKDEEK